MTLTNSLNGFDGAQELLIKLVEQSPEDWETRKRVVQVLYDSGFYRDASKLVWNAPEVPPITEDVVFTARVVAMGQPERAVRLVSTMIESNQGNPEENLKVAKALVKEGLVLQALRFYGAATAGDPSLSDESFELVLVNADCGDENWRDIAEGEEFPWEGPRDTSIADIMDGEGDASAAEMLLSSVTQRVPLKAPVKNSSDISESAPVSQDIASSPVKTPKPMLSPAAEALVKQQAESSRIAAGSDGAVSPEQANEDGSFSSLVNFFKHKEMEQGQEMEPEKKPPVKSQPLVTIATSVDTRAQTSADGPAPSSPLIQGFQPRPSEALKQVVPEVVVAATEAQVPDPAPVPEVEPVDEVAPESFFQPSQNKVPAEAPAAAVFSSHEPVSIEPEPEIEEPNDFADVAGLTETEPVVENVAPATPPVEVYEEPASVQTEQPIAQEEDLSDAVASALAERQTNQPESQGGGFLDKIKGMFSRSKSGKTIEVQDEVFSSEIAAEPATPAVSEQVTMPDATAPQLVSAESSPPVPEVTEPVATEPSNPSGQARAISSPVSTTVLRKPEQDQHEPPRELDGRTQLVALAPQDGSVFFDQLSAKYTSVPAGQLPPAALVARDMANVDYVQLIREACSKDLNAFSKLLGLHRVMTESDCSAWVEDMDLLRKGYGDAVLATVVSKYSVAECREILGAVYQRPRDQAAAG